MNGGRNSRPGAFRAFLLCLLAALVPAAAAPADRGPALADRYDFRARHDPSGIGKFYLGREIAQVMGHEGADWLDRPERNAEEHTEELVAALRVRPGEVVADIGAGTGYFSQRLATKVGPAGKVLAVDIQPEMLNQLTNRMSALGISNVVPVLGTTMDPRLPAGQVDMALLVDVYHEFEFPHEMVEGICRSLKPGGQIVFAEFRGEDPAVPIKPLHKMTEAQVRKEMAGHPLRWVRTDRQLPRQHLIFFQKIPNPQRREPARLHSGPPAKHRRLSIEKRTTAGSG